MDIKVVKENKLLKMEIVIKVNINKENFMAKVLWLLYRHLYMG